MNQFFTFLLICLLGISCKQTEQTPATSRPNILLIVSEDNGPDLGCYGVKEVTTPHLDNLAKEGVRFENAYVTYSVCSPSRGTIFTGLYPHQNGQIGLATHKYRMYDSIQTLPTIMKEGGYRTGCIGKIHVNPEKWLKWDFRPGGLLNGANFGKKKMPLYAEKSKEFISASDEPFFLMVNYPDAHFPVQRDVEGLPTIKVNAEDLDHTLPFIGIDSDHLKEYTANYYNCMNRLDESVGMLLEELHKSGKEDNTLVIYLGDHGAQFSRAKCSNYEAGLQVPFIMKWNGIINKGQVRKELLSSIDLLPTILSVAGIEQPKQYEFPGRDLSVFFDGKSVNDWREYVYAGGTGSAAHWFFPRRSVRNNRFKLIQNLRQDIDNPKVHAYATHVNGHFDGGTEYEELETASAEVKEAYRTWLTAPMYELYDLANDPLELNNLASNSQFDVQFNDLKSALRNWQKETEDPLAITELYNRFHEESKVNADRASGKKNIWEYPTYFKKYFSK